MIEFINISKDLPYIIFKKLYKEAYKANQNNIEAALVSSFSKENTISKYLSKKSEGIHHICIEVDNIESEMKRVINSGIRVLNDNPKVGADNKKICFLHPKDTCGVLIELSQEINQ